MQERTKKQLRVAEQIHEILSELIQFEAGDPRLALVNITNVEIDRELMYADVYVDSSEEEENRKELLRALEQASSFLRFNLAKQMYAQRVPELRFKWDESVEQGRRIEALLDSLKQEQEEPGDA